VKPLNPLLKWYGSKHSSGKHYPAPLPGSTIFEPFAGSAGYALRYHWHPVVIWENNPRLQELWCWLIYKASSQDILDIPLNVPEGTDIRTLGMSWGQQLLLKHWQRTNNVGECWTVSKWGSLPGQFTSNTRARVADQVNAIKHWQFRQPTWTEPGTYLCDSPYIYNYQYKVKNFDYPAYVANVNKIPPGSLIIACEAVCPKTGRIPDYLPFTPSHSQVTSRRKATENHHSKELVYVKYT
jgi:hypothetical protein